MKLDSEKILSLWSRCQRLPLGKELFSRTIGFLVPYSGSIGAKILKIEPGLTEIELREHRAVRNHLASIHAVALANLGELSTGLACLTSLPPRSRAILKSLTTEYHRKSRGRIVARAQCPKVETVEKSDVTIVGCIFDEDDSLLATVTAVWRVDKEK